MRTLFPLNSVLSLCQAGLFSGVAATFIVQVIQSLQPDPGDVTNVLLLRILQQNTSFDGTDPLAPLTHTSPSAVAAQCILFVCLVMTFFIAFCSVICKSLVYSYARQSKLGGAVDEGKKLQLWFLGLGNRGLYALLAFLEFMVECAVGLFDIGFVVFLWGINLASAATMLSLSIFVMLCFWTLGGFMLYIPQKPEPQKETPSDSLEGVDNKLSSMTLSNPDFWRKDPFLTPPPPQDIVSSAGAWLLENGGDFSAATAVAVMFPEFQWPLSRPCTTALIRLRDAYDQCFRTPKFDTSTRLNALQSATAYYVLYHTQLARESSKTISKWAQKLPPDLPLDLFLHEHTEEWGGDGVFEYLLHTEDRSESVTSARFLSYIAPFWFCGNSDSSIQSRPSRLEKMHELIEVLEKSEAFTPATLANCVLCVGAAMDFPLHPEDLVRVDKRCVRSFGRRW